MSRLRAANSLLEKARKETPDGPCRHVLEAVQIMLDEQMDTERKESEKRLSTKAVRVRNIHR
jgi:hypothetical protein